MIEVGEWVQANHLKTKVTGYVVEIYGSCIEVYVTLPKNYGQRHGTFGLMTFDKYNVAKADEAPSPDDRHDLIDLTLQLRDREWFNNAIRGVEGI